MRLAAWAHGRTDRPTVLLVHGYPDTHAVWDVIAAALAQNWHVVRYDVRGSGESERPSTSAAYALTALVDDARAVVRAAGRSGRSGRVHLVGHDWGSITGWEAVTAPDAAAWIASYTSISGASLSHVGAWVHDRLRHPTPAGIAPMLEQQARSWYLALFQVPGVAETAWRRVLAPRWAARLARTEGLPLHPAQVRPTLVEDAIAGLNLYRANLFRPRRRPPARPAAAPVQFVVPLRDRYVRPALAAVGLPWASPAWWRTIDSGHWGALITHGGQVASWIDEFARHIEGASESAALAAARVRGLGLPPIEAI